MEYRLAKSKDEDVDGKGGRSGWEDVMAIKRRWG